MSDSEAQVFRKVRRRLMPILMLCYFGAFIDRVNVGFAALSMNADLGFGPVVYGWGAGIFFLGYFLFEVPSNVLLSRLGARVWIARIMITWGIVSMAMAAVQGPASFYVLRFLLGVAEAGFYPGVVLYLTFWFPQEERAKVMGWFTLANPVSTVIGAPISGLILSLGHLGGLRNWQWLFLVEGAPALVLGTLVWLWLRDGPAQAAWLTPAEREVIERRVERDRASRAIQRHLTLWEGLANPLVLGLGLVYFGCIAGNYGLSFWLPQLVKGFGLTDLQTGLVTALPYACGAVAMVYWGAHSDRTGERTWHVALPLLLASASLLAASRVTSPVVAMALLCAAGVGVFANTPPFWTLPTALMTGTASAGAIALVNSIGNLSGFVAPYLIGWIKASTGNIADGLMALAAMPLLAVALTLWLQRGARLRRLAAGTVP
jgi:D-galactonate transporter